MSEMKDSSLGMLEKWESLTTRVEETQMASALHRELTALQTEFKAAHDRLFSYEIALEQPHLLDERLNRITTELAALRDRKVVMLALNISTHRLITNLGNSASLIFTALKDGVADLYRVWDETFQKGLTHAKGLTSDPVGFYKGHSYPSVLKYTRREINNCAPCKQSSSLVYVARLLSEKQDMNCQIVTLVSFPSPSPNYTQEGGSLSDSGISDSGSEQELSERERRLAALRRLTRSVKNQLAPGSEALGQLWKRVEDTETELRDLQKQCRELIVRTAASVEARASKRTSNSQVHHYSDKRKKTSPTEMARGNSERITMITAKSGVTDAGDPDNEPGLPQSWVWRILRAALPFQLALVALFCAACLLEPHCCEAANTLNLSLTLQLRYVRGPPPV
ncbi:klarsicht protein-like [Osmia lignaria lignaria]|uniref:klarsicht protein-like n=1 Tax=Osmia lignaria lignaria TaxID=1437193 RepID=UPI001478FA47|nr:nesprin-1-like [Osmia lignaria]